MHLISNSYAYEISIINSLHAQNVSRLRQREHTAGYNSCERACRCVSDCPRAGRCVRHAQCVARAPHAYTCRTDWDLCHWLRSVHRRVYRRSTVPRVRIERTARSTRHLSLDLSCDVPRTRSLIFHAVDHRLLNQHGLLIIYESYEFDISKRNYRFY